MSSLRIISTWVVLLYLKMHLLRFGPNNINRLDFQNLCFMMQVAKESVSTNPCDVTVCVDETQIKNKKKNTWKWQLFWYLDLSKLLLSINFSAVEKTQQKKKLIHLYLCKFWHLLDGLFITALAGSVLRDSGTKRVCTICNCNSVGDF